jgi:hypothetical protein
MGASMEIRAQKRREGKGRQNVAGRVAGNASERRRRIGTSKCAVKIF